MSENKTALIYGGGGAIGGAVARAFAGAGARVYLAEPDHGNGGCAAHDGALVRNNPDAVDGRVPGPAARVSATAPPVRRSRR